MDLVEQIYMLSARFAGDERFGLTTQLRRASVSVPSNIAEGYARGGGDYGRFVDIAQGSLAEIETQLELALRPGFVAPTDAAMTIDLAAEVGRMLHGLRKSLAPSA